MIHKVFLTKYKKKSKENKRKKVEVGQMMRSFSVTTILLALDKFMLCDSVNIICINVSININHIMNTRRSTTRHFETQSQSPSPPDQILTKANKD